jgi:hypothetical protein
MVYGNRAGAGSVGAHRVQQRPAAQRFAAFRHDFAKVRARLADTLDQDAALKGASATKTDDGQLNLGVLKP